MDDPVNVISFFETFLLPSRKFGDNASICLEMDVVLAKLRTGTFLNEVKSILESTFNEIQSSSAKEPVVLSKFYKASAEYRKVGHSINYRTRAKYLKLGRWSSSRILQGSSTFHVLYVIRGDGCE